MSDAAVVSALIAKRKDLQDRAEELAEELDRLQQTISHLEGAIVAFDPTWVPSRKKKPVVSMGLFQQGELTRGILDEMRIAGTPLTTREIAERLIARSNNLEKTPDLVATVVQLACRALITLRRRRVVESMRRPGRGNLWSIRKIE